MRIFKILFLSVCLMLFGNQQLKAQKNLLDVQDLSSVNIDAYKDEDLKVFLGKVNSLKISQQEVYNLLKAKGLPDAEAEKLKNRLSIISLRANQEEKDKYKPEEEEKRVYDSSANKLPMQDNLKNMDVFGAELFTKNSMVFEPNLRIPTPSSYILGPDDEVIINVFGMSEKKYKLQVTEDGEIYIPNVGPLYVTGLSIEQATQKIKSRLASTIYKAINSGKTSVQISLGNIRSIRVTVIGQAQKPGTLTVSSLTTLFNALYLCGGPGPKGSFRAIEVIRGNQVKRVADLYSFLVEGNQSDNILLQEGDVIRIPYYSNMVKLTGNVKRTGLYEIKENETVDKLIIYCGGFDEKAYKQGITITRIGDLGKKVFSLEKKDFNSFALNAGDECFVSKNSDKYINRVTVKGSVLRPGDYEISDGLNLNELIERAGGTTDDAYLQRASIFRYMQNRVPTIESINLDSCIRFKQTVKIYNNDSVFIHSIFDFRDSMYVNIDGNVRNPSVIKWRENMSLFDVILAAGGITELGDSNNIEISRRVMNANVNQANHSESQLINTGLHSNTPLMPFDQIIVKSSSGYVVQRSVTLVGDVKIPGKYILQKSGDKILDVIKRAEGFKASADSSSATVRRIIKSNLSLREREALFQRLLNIDNDSLASNQKLRNEVYKSYEIISVNIEQTLANPNSPENLVLEDGDVITVDKNTSLVKVSGEVYYPTILPYDGKRNAKYYIKQAGNSMPSARKGGVLVIYPNGKAKSVKSFLFFRSYPRVISRSEVFVPQKNKSNKNKIGLGELAVIASALGVVANVILSAIKQ